MVAIFQRLYYALSEYRNDGGATLILGAGCSLASTSLDVSTIGIMKQSLYEHNEVIDNEMNWETIYKKFINTVWTGKTNNEKRRLLNKRFEDMQPTDGHRYLKNLVQEGYIHNIITTNFDMLIEKTFEGMSYLKASGNDEYIKVGNEKPKFNLLKVHGELESGQLRFSPFELMELPSNLSNEINEKTHGLTIFLGYRGQDIGLMKSINRDNSSAIYWVDVVGPLNQTASESDMINDLLLVRSSRENVIYGKEYGDFQKVLKDLNSLLILKNHKNIIEAKKHHLSSMWKDTTIVNMLKINSRFYNLFLSILYCSEIISTSYECNEKLYSSYLNSYLYTFKNKLLPSKLVNILKNEIDVLILGVSLEIIVRAYSSNVESEIFIDRLYKTFSEEINNSILFDLPFWNTVKNLLNFNCINDDNSIKINFKNNNLNVESIDIQYAELGELMQIIKILSAVVYAQNEKYKAFYGKQSELSSFEDKIYINLGEIDSNDKAFLNDTLIKKLPYLTIIPAGDQTKISSKWLEIKFSIKDDNYKSENSLLELCLNQCNKTTQDFLNLGIIKNEKYIKLRLDNDIAKFASSDKIAMFIIGPSGAGKTTAIRNFMTENKEIYFSVVSSKSNQTEKIGLSSFMGIDIDENEVENVIRTLNETLTVKNFFLYFIIDGINELNSSNQVMQYLKVIELAEKLYNQKCTNIKIIVTCREHAYFQYKESTGKILNHLCFFSNDKAELGTVGNQDACYRVKSFNNDEFNALVNCYIHDKKILKYINKINMQNITPLYFAIIEEYFLSNSFNSVNFNSNNMFFEIFSRTMLGRLSKTNELLAKKIIFTYFNLIIKQNSIYVTRFMIENMLFLEFNDDKYNLLSNTINELIDINILVADFTKYQPIKFNHDKIEEFFFAKYLEQQDVFNNEVLNKILDICQKNLIYQGGFVQFLISKANENLEDFKDIVTSNAPNNMNILPKLTIDAISHFNNPEEDLIYLLHERDYLRSEALINIIITGIDDSLFFCSLLTYDLIILISNRIVNNDVKSFMYYFKSKLYYFNNNFDAAAEAAEKSIKIINQNNTSLITKLNMHKAVILMEFGNSADSASILNSEFKKHTNNFNNKLRIGIELGRVLNHNGQIKTPLKIYDELLNNDSQITDPYILARLYSQKGDSLMKVLFEKLQNGFVAKEKLSENVKNEAKTVFDDMIFFYKQSMDLFMKANEVFYYSGVVPELINTYVCYSMSLDANGIDECKDLIVKTDNLFENITTPYKADFYLAKAYYYEYLVDIAKAIECIQIAQAHSKNLKIKNKEAKCNLFYGQFAYRQILNNRFSICSKFEWKSSGMTSIIKALEYYKKYTNIHNNYYINNCKTLICLFNQVN